MGSIVFAAARALVAWLEQHGGNLQGIRALGIIFSVLNGFGYDVLCFNGSGYDLLCFTVLDMMRLVIMFMIFPVLMIPKNLIESACYIESFLHVRNRPWVT